MKVNVTFRRLEPSEALRNYAQEKVARVKRYLQKEAEANIILSLEKHRHIAEINLLVNGLTIVSKEETQDMYSAIDLAMEKIERQVLKYKDKIQKHKFSPSPPGIDARLKVFSGESFEQDQEPKLVKTKNFFIKPMSLEEAVMQMDLLDNNFLVFTNATSSRVNVIYRRRDGDYGLIEPDL